MQPLPPLPSIYRDPVIQRRLRALHRLLRRRNIPVYPIGRSYIPGKSYTAPDQAWLQDLLLMQPC